MSYTPLLCLTLAIVAATGLYLQESESYFGLLSGLNTKPVQTPLKDLPRNIRALQQDLNGRSGSNSLSRVRRSDLRKPENYSACCGSAVYFEFSEEIVSTYPECHPDNLGGGGYVGESFNVSVLCAPYQCFYKKKGLVDDDGYVIQDAFVNTVNSWFTEDPLKDLAQTTAPDCITEANAFARQQLNETCIEQGCNVAPFWAQFCVQAIIVMRCPADLRDNSEECDKNRAEIFMGLEVLNSTQQST